MIAGEFECFVSDIVALAKDIKAVSQFMYHVFSILNRKPNLIIGPI